MIEVQAEPALGLDVLKDLRDDLSDGFARRGRAAVGGDTER